MRKTGTLVSWLMGGILVCACSSSTSHKDGGADAAIRDSATGDSEMGDADMGDAGLGDTGIGDAATSDTGPADVGVQAVMLTIGSGMRFTTPALVVPTGTTITVENQDIVPHTVTSETAPDAFNPSGAFDTGIITGGGSASITIPANAAPGSVTASASETNMLPVSGRPS